MRGDHVFEPDRHSGLRRCVVTGGSGCGKTTQIDHLRSLGYPCVEEAAIRVIEEKRRAHASAEEFLEWQDGHFADFQRAVFERQRELERALQGGASMVFMDRSGVDCIAYLESRGLRADREMLAYARHARFARVFVLDTLRSFEERRDSGRGDDHAHSIRIRDRLLDVYRRFGADPVLVPERSVEERSELILSRIAASERDPGA